MDRDFCSSIIIIYDNNKNKKISYFIKSICILIECKSSYPTGNRWKLL